MNIESEEELLEQEVDPEEIIRRLKRIKERLSQLHRT
tara:strand:+ start:6365 stop:6475 length:111 start_codon:yes stop_codon:yes gene_type:complete